MKTLHALLLASAFAFAAACGPGAAETAKQAEYHYKLGTNFFYDRNTQSALEELYRAIEIEPAHKEAHHLLGFIYFGRQDWPRAQLHFETAVRLDPEFDEAVANLGNLYLATEQWAASVPYFDKLLGKPLYKTPHLAHNNLGWALYNLGRYDEARRHLETAIFLNPKMCLAYNNLGRLHAHLGETDRALERFQKAVELCESYAEPHYFLGRICLALANGDCAKKHFRKCHDLGPETPFGRRCREAM